MAECNNLCRHDENSERNVWGSMQTTKSRERLEIGSEMTREQIVLNDDRAGKDMMTG